MAPAMPTTPAGWSHPPERSNASVTGEPRRGSRALRRESGGVARASLHPRLFTVNPAGIRPWDASDKWIRQRLRRPRLAMVLLGRETICTVPTARTFAKIDTPTAAAALPPGARASRPLTTYGGLERWESRWFSPLRSMPIANTWPSAPSPDATGLSGRDARAPTARDTPISARTLETILVESPPFDGFAA